MPSEIYRYTFDESVSMSDAESTLQLAILAAESLLGESIVRLDAAYSIDEQRRVCVVDASTEVGRSICRIFTGYLTREFGDHAFQVRPVQGRKPNPVAVPA